MMEQWNVGILGMKSGKRSFLQKMLILTFMMIVVRHPFSAFILKSIPSKLKKSMQNYAL